MLESEPLSTRLLFRSSLLDVESCCLSPSKMPCQTARIALTVHDVGRNEGSRGVHDVGHAKGCLIEC